MRDLHAWEAGSTEADGAGPGRAACMSGGLINPLTLHAIGRQAFSSTFLILPSSLTILTYIINVLLEQSMCG